MPTPRALNLRHGLRVGTKGVVGNTGILTDVGDISLLSTTDKTGIVNAVNEVKGNFLNITTAQVAEDQNYLYFTTARARQSVSVTDAGGDGSLAYNNTTGVITYTGPSASEVRAHFTGGTGVTITNGTVAIGQAVATSSNVTFNDTTLTGVLYGPANFVIDPAAPGDNTGKVTILGDFEVKGVTTTIDSVTVAVGDKNLLLAKDSTSSAQADGGGITLAGANASFNYASVTDSWNPNKTLKGIAGEAVSPTYSFATDTDSGLYSSGANSASIATGGVERLRLTDTAATLIGSVDFTLNRGTYGGTVTVSSLTANRTYTFPNVNGTVVTTGDTGTVTSVMIADGTITDTDVSATAEIAVSKLADGAARQLLQTDAAGTGVEWTSNVDIPGTLDVTGISTFDTKIVIGAAETANEREVAWNTDEGTLDVQLLNGVITHIGQDTITLCRNNTLASIPKGTAVMFNGTIGNSGRIAVAPMIANGTMPGYVFFGVTAQAIAAGEDGYVKSYGEIKGINTNAFEENDILWCNPAVPGGFTRTEPSAPNLKLPVAAVISKANNGILMIRWATGSRLRDLHDVESNGSTANGDILVYNFTAQRWENGSTLPSLSLTTSLVFEGSTVDDFETTLSVVDPTADRSILLPNLSGTLATTADLSQFAATTSAQLAGVISDETGTGSLVFATSPSLTTPTLGVASATSVNKVAITAPATSATLTIADGKTLTVSNTLTFTGTDTSSVAFGTGGTVAYTSNKLSVFAATTSTELAGVISDETGTGALVFAASPTLSGTPLSTTAAVDTNTTQIATTAFVVGQASATNPLALGAVAIGTSLRYSRQDHVHPTTGLGLTSGTLAQFAATTSSQLAGVISDETGTGSLVFSTSPSLTTPAIGAATGTSLSLTGGGLTARPAATQDAMIVSGRAGGTGSFAVTVTPTTLTASRTLTAPNVSGTIVTTGDTGTITSAMIENGTIVDADINTSAAIADTKLATISTAGKVSNSATTATNSNTFSAIVARDGSGNFSAGTITAALTGAASSNVLKAGDTLTGALLLDDAANTATAPALAFDGDTNTGIFRSAADTLNVATNGVENVEFGTSEVVFNDGGADIDFRIEGDTKANLFKVDAGTDKVLIDGITQPSADGTADQSVVTNGSGVLSFATRGRIILDTTKTATGTSVDFTSIPSWAKSITVAFAGVSTDGTDDYLIQLGDAGGIETTGYLGTAAVIGVSAANFTAGFGIISSAGANVHHGAITLTAMGANVWVASGTLGRSNSGVAIVTAGSKTLSDTLTQVRITTVNGTNGFDAGNFNILYNG